MNAVERDRPARIHVVLPAHNRRDVTAHFVASLRRQTWREVRLVLIDDGSTDGTAEAVRAIWPTVEVVRGRGHWWWAGSLQAGCRHLAQSGTADEDVVLLINDDVEIDADFLERGRTELAALPDTLLLARQTDAATGRELDGGGGIHADLSELRFSATAGRAINCLPTRGLFLRWSDLVRTGGFRPDLLPHYLSDYEFTLRAARYGLRLAVARHTRLGVHLGRSGPSSETLFELSRAKRFTFFFSTRYKDNPVTWSAFAWLAAPPFRRPYLWVKIWANFLRTVVQCTVIPPRPAGPPR